MELVRDTMEDSFQDKDKETEDLPDNFPFTLTFYKGKLFSISKRNVWFSDKFVFRDCKLVLRNSHFISEIIWSDPVNHAYQSLACETAINTDFSELFSLKRIYVKYKNAILSLLDSFFRTWKD